MRAWWVVIALCGCVAEPDHAPAPGGVVINEVSASGKPHDWFEIVNTGDAPVELSEMVFVDQPGDFVRARHFPAITLGPGERHVQEVVRAEHGFQLGDSEELCIYRHEDRTLIDRVGWRAGSSPAGGSYARTPDLTGSFARSPRSSPGRINPTR